MSVAGFSFDCIVESDLLLPLAFDCKPKSSPDAVQYLRNVHA